MTLFNRSAAAHTSAAMSPPRAVLFGALAVAATMILPWDSASAGMVPTVPLGTSAAYSVVGSATVTNTGPSVLNRSLALSPGPAVTGFTGAPEGTVNGTIDVADAVAAQARADLTTAYLDAAGRSSDMILGGSNLSGQNLLPGVWGDGSALSLSVGGTVTLDGNGSYDSVFIIHSGSSLVTGSSSTVALTNGAQACNVFWVVPSDATLGSGSTFAGNILALNSIWLQDSVTVNGRALARNGEVTLINDVFTVTPCQTGLVQSTPPADTATTTPADAGTAAADGTATAVDDTAVTVAGTTTDITTNNNTTGTTRFGDRPGNDLTLRLPETGRPVGAPIAMAAAFLALGAVAMWFGRRKLAPQA